MKSVLKFVVMLGLAILAGTSFADPPGRVGRVNLASGAVSFAPGEAPDEWVQVPLNRPLTAGDRLWADADGRAEMHIGSTALRMGPRTNVDVLNLDDHTIQLRLAQGDLVTRVRDLPAGDRIEIATPSGAVVLQQPGSYRVNVDPQSDSARVIVNFGQAQVITPAQSMNVPSSQAMWFSNSAPPQFEIVGAASADPFDRWSAERDRAEDRIASTRYVSPYMTGYEDLDHHGQWTSYPEYGAVWVPTRVAPGWAPYRYGHWAWISPWGWTWIDDAPWGFAPFHYGRWVYVGNRWAWAPGTYAPRPVYAPALVAFIGGSNFSVSVSTGPAVGWFPLGWREPYRPWYNASPTYVRNVNVTHVTNVTNITNVTYVNQANPQAVTVVPQQAFVSARSAAQSAVRVDQSTLARADVAQAAPPAAPVRASFAQQDRRGRQPPANVVSREVVAVTAPATPATAAAVAPQSGAAAPAAASQPRGERDSRVRVIGRERGEGRAAERGEGRATERAEGRGAERAPAAPAAAAPAAAAPAAAPTAAGPSTPPAATAAPAAPAAAPPAKVAPAPAAATAPAPVARPPAQTEQRQERQRERQERAEQRAAPAAAAPAAAPMRQVRPEPAARPEAPRAQPAPPVQRAELPRAQPPVQRPEPQRREGPPPAARAEPPRPQAQPQPQHREAQPQQQERRREQREQRERPPQG